MTTYTTKRTDLPQGVVGYRITHHHLNDTVHVDHTIGGVTIQNGEHSVYVPISMVPAVMAAMAKGVTLDMVGVHHCRCKPTEDDDPVTG